MRPLFGAAVATCAQWIKFDEMSTAMRWLAVPSTETWTT
jgi:hypothetical protein